MGYVFNILGNLLFLILTLSFLFWVLSSINKGRYCYVGGRTHINRAERRADKEYMRRRVNERSF